MKIDIIGSESLGVRGLCCSVETAGRRILIDPGIALGYQRARRLPHPLQVAVGERIRKRIVSYWAEATDIVISHFHGDHVPLRDANPFQLALHDVAELNRDAAVWVKSRELSQKEKLRAADFSGVVSGGFRSADSVNRGIMEFSSPVPHGSTERRRESVIMTRIEGKRTFVHASDIQLLNSRAVDKILAWEPDVILAGGPPLYLKQISAFERECAWMLALALARSPATLILDHHLLRSREGLQWLDGLSEKSGKRIFCSADFMGKSRLLLEADRRQLYHAMPVPDSWHTDYARGHVRPDEFWEKGIALGLVSDLQPVKTLCLA